MEKYINAEDDLEHLVRIALIHYQFETIYPFLDGNGRIGRLLIVLYLLEKEVMKMPSLYLSFYLKEHRIEIEIGKTATALSISYNTVSSAISKLEEPEILYLVNKRKRNKIYSYKEYLDILRTGTDPLKLNISTKE